MKPTAKPAVLVTRPAGQAEPLCALLEAKGYRPVRFPLLEIRELEKLPFAARRALARLEQFHALIFVSANAARHGMRWIEAQWPRLPAGLEWFAVGEGSAAALAERGIRARHPPVDMSSEGLLAMPELARMKGWRVLIVKGRGGRDALRAELRRRGAAAEEVALYERRPVRAAPRELFRLIEGETCRAILLSSGEGLNNMVSLLSRDERARLRERLLVAPGARVAAAAEACGFSRVAAADNAGDAAMVAALESALTG